MQEWIVLVILGTSMLLLGKIELHVRRLWEIAHKSEIDRLGGDIRNW